MRIISGLYRRKVLISPDTDYVRPTSDRAKETLFNILNNRINFSGINCLDLFCGTGNLGLESISRGSGKCSFVDTDTKLVIKNIEKVGVYEQSEVYKSDSVEFLKRNTEKKYDLIFCDPPYDYPDYKKLTEYLMLYKTLTILEHSAKYETEDEFSRFVILRKKIGTVNFTFFDFKNNI